MVRESNRATALTEGAPQGPDAALGRFIASSFDAALQTALHKGWFRGAAELQQRLRAERSLHSASRRYAADAMHQMLRGLRRLRALSGLPRADGRQLYLTWLVDQQGPPLPGDLLAALRRAQLDPEALWQRRSSLSLGEELSYPDWLVNACVDELGAERARAFLQAQNQRAPLTVRANVHKGTREALQERLRGEGVEARPTRRSPWGLQLLTRHNVYGLAAFQEGLLELQDEGSQLIAELCAPPPGGAVIDVCAGAGGKTLALGAMMHNRGRLIALDVDADKLQELRKRVRRAGLSNVQAQLLGEGGVAAARLSPAARVLCDVPCSGLGVLRRHPEARWRLGPQDLAELREKQARILQDAAAWVAPHGRLIYSTCTVLRSENDAVVDAFLARNPAFQAVPVKEILGGARAQQIGDGERLRLLPTGAEEDEPDGFFAAVLRRHSP